MQNKNDNSTFGIDINEYTQNVNFEVISTKIDFLYLRSSGSGTGRFRVDTKFLEYASEARNYGIPVGAYHYGVPSYDLTTADSQCDDFINVLQSGFGNKNYGDLFPVLDIESPVEKIISTQALTDWINRFRRRFESKTRRRLMLYTGTFFIDIYDNFYVKGKGFPLKSMILWIAMYTSIPGNPPFPNDAGGWTRWRIWQFSENFRMDGVGTPVDANWGPDSLDLLMQPANVTGFTAVTQGNNIVVTWNKVPSIDLLGYNLFVNNNWVGTVDKDKTRYIINKDKYPNQKITISIEAFDYDGEVSKNRSRVSI